MPTTFIAVQCFQCSTMQVKQQKKSSNKWSCVVCGEKQSLRKVFSQGFMAKDVRVFVQKFNMSRQLQEGKKVLDSPSNEEETERKRRTDWTEYVVDDSVECLGRLDFEHGDSELEPMVVTEIPKALFKKPKLKGNYVSGSKFPNTGLQFNEFQKTARKGVSRRDQTMKNQEACSDEKRVDSQCPDGALKWNALRAQIQQVNNDSSANREPWTSQSTKIAGGSVSKWDVYSTGNENEAPSRLLHAVTAAKEPASKWSCFVTEDDYDELQIRGKEGSSDGVSSMNSDALGSLMNDEKVEDDIHPDFL